MPYIGIPVAIVTIYILFCFSDYLYKKIDDYRLNHPKRKKSPKYIAGKPKF